VETVPCKTNVNICIDTVTHYINLYDMYIYSDIACHCITIYVYMFYKE